MQLTRHRKLWYVHRCVLDAITVTDVIVAGSSAAVFFCFQLRVPELSLPPIMEDDELVNLKLVQV